MSRGNSGQGTFGGFIIGAVVFGIGAYLILQNTVISTQFSLVDIIGFTPPFGLVLLPFLLGLGMLFFNSKSILGWILMIFGIITILLGILMGLRVYFKSITLYQTILMYGLTAAGIGLMVKAFIGKNN